MRKHLVQSAGYWYKVAYQAAAEGRTADAMLAFEQCYNHTENALAAAARVIRYASGVFRSYELKHLEKRTPENLAERIAKANANAKEAEKLEEILKGINLE